MTEKEIRAELAQIGGRLLKSDGWKWQGGMLITAEVSTDSHVWTEDHRCIDVDPEGVPFFPDIIAHDSEIDLTDPATIGCLIAQLIVLDPYVLPQWDWDQDAKAYGYFTDVYGVHITNAPSLWLGYCLAVARVADQVLS